MAPVIHSQAGQHDVLVLSWVSCVLRHSSTEILLSIDLVAYFGIHSEPPSCICSRRAGLRFEYDSPDWGDSAGAAAKLCGEIPCCENAGGAR